MPHRFCSFHVPTYIFYQEAISYHPHSRPVLNYWVLPLATYQWLPTYLSPVVTFAYSQFLPWREVRINLSK